MFRKFLCYLGFHQLGTPFEQRSEVTGLMYRCHPCKHCGSVNFFHKL